VMEETLTPDVIINKSQIKIGDKTYSYYCERKRKEDADAICDDLIASGFDAISRKGIVDYHTYYMVWWRKK
jgi:hypothetical protein